MSLRGELELHDEVVEWMDGLDDAEWDRTVAVIDGWPARPVGADAAVAEPRRRANGLYKAECVRGPDAPAVWDDVANSSWRPLARTHGERRARSFITSTSTASTVTAMTCHPQEFEAAFYAAQ